LVDRETPELLETLEIVGTGARVLVVVVLTTGDLVVVGRM
jgi:hypothetical protein